MRIDFPPSFFAANRERLIDSTTAYLVVATANGILQRNGDNTYPFRQDSNFWYLTGLNIPDVIWVFDKSLDEEYLILPERSKAEDIFDGEHDATEIAKISGITQVLTHKEGWSWLREALLRKPKLATLQAPPERLETFTMYTNPARRFLTKALKDLDVTETVDLREAIALQRQVKQAVEIKAIRQAVNITCKTLETDIKPRLGALKTERDVENLLTFGYSDRGADGHSFDPVVAMGKNAVTLHYRKHNALLTNNALLLIDTGAEVQNYAADITRCYPLGKPSDRTLAVYTAVYEAQQVGIAAIRPGKTFKEIDQLVNEHLERALQDLKLKPIGDKSLLRSYYPHAWHFMGLDVHDVGDYTRALEPGMVMTVEPGIYIANEGIGVRIEDDVLVTKTGCEVLSKASPTKPSEVFSL